MSETKLWDSTDCGAWHRALDSYEEVVRAQEVSGLEELDRWYREELPGVLVSRTPAYVTREELVQVTRWKMKRGVWRQRNLLLVEANPEAEVEATSREAFAAAPDPRKPVSLLVRLAGVGPATASGVLAVHSPEVYPFFDELVVGQIPGLGEVAFTAPFYYRYAEMLRKRTEELNGGCEHRTWTADGVSQALWSASGGKAAWSS
ncbi:MAG: hypothetical protein M3437_08045 [Chloroflexota bacterium]|nr:hypothetical protein [Chloroflexota bacterium]MDQ5864426.1 hypothetical protein [Chloroflexota bacterium]